MVPWNAARTKVQIRLSIQRLRTLQEKRLALAKKSRREIADLLLKGRVETAKLRVEGLIQDDIYVELLELLELYTEKLQARFGLLDASVTEPEASIEDAVCAVVYAAPRTELKELQVLRELIMHKFGRAWSLAMQPSDPPPASVPPRIISKLALYTPPKELVDAYLGEIAKSYGVPYEVAQPMEKLEDPDEGSKDNEDKNDDEEDGGGPGEGQEKERVGELEPALTAPKDGQAKTDADRSKTSPAPSTKPDERTSDTQASLPETPAPAAAPAPASAPKKVNEDDELAKRFERLKNLR